ncbi:hypothetical protein [Bdellovibrio bacteriovorus]|uniref:Uncharacterized protein n=1 Tax=Bdellovibrio bacteriovorus TaxID=959 RepID=A0A150WKS5_BDEBC|nr:hypothetical protein [Bdellovibrio bacteriovorus]KYG64534.1 hypothetical protein AZI85_03735 [Bdellovibrio bacteriovorus]
MKTWMVLCLCSILSGCSLEAQIDDLGLNKDSVVQAKKRIHPDFISAEVVSLSSGYRVTATFGEITENKVTSNGWKVRGVFYE